MSTVDPRRELVQIVRRVKENEIKQDATAAVSAKVSVGANPITSQGASLITSVQKQDAVQASADALKLSAETLTRVGPAAVAPVANTTSAVASVITSVHQGAEGNTYTAASAATTAIEKLSPALAKSPVGAFANLVLIRSAGKVEDAQKDAIKTSAAKVLSSNAPVKARLKASFDLTAAVQNLVNLYRTVGNAVWKLGGFTLRMGTKVAALAPAAASAQGKVAKVAVSPLGRTVGFLNKWLPFLNVAGVALSAKNAIDVFHDKQASKTSKALSVASIGTAVAALVGGFRLKGLAFVGTIVAGIVADVALAESRSSDAQGLDTDARSRYWATHPMAAGRDLIGWAGHTIPAVATSIRDTVARGFARVKTLFTH